MTVPSTTSTDMYAPLYDPYGAYNPYGTGTYNPYGMQDPYLALFSNIGNDPANFAAGGMYGQIPGLPNSAFDIANDPYLMAAMLGYQEAYSKDYGNTDTFTGEKPSPKISDYDLSQMGVKLDEDGNQKMLTADDINDLVEGGIYDSPFEALLATIEDGYGVSEEEQLKLGIFTDKTEEKIKVLMDKYGISREDAIIKLGDDKIQIQGDYSEVTAKFNELVNQGFSRKEAYKHLTDLGYEVPAELKKEPPKYKEADEEKIQNLMMTTGCSRDEAISTLKVKPKRKGTIKMIADAGVKIVDTVGKGINNIVTAITDAIW